MSTLDQLQEIIHAYENMHNILLCGDKNSLLLKRHGNPQDQMLYEVLLQLGLSSHKVELQLFSKGMVEIIPKKTTSKQIVNKI